MQFWIYAIASVVLGYFSYLSMMMGVWGAPVHASHYLAVCGALGLMAGAFMCRKDYPAGRGVALASLAALGPLWFPAILVLAPERDIHVSPLGYLFVVLYFGTALFALNFPTRSKLGLIVSFGLIAGALGWAGVTTLQRNQRGEYERPEFTFYKWQSGNEPVSLDGDVPRKPSADLAARLNEAGIRGKLERVAGSRGGTRALSQIIVIARSQPPEPHVIQIPRRGMLICIYDGESWRHFPSSLPVYPVSVTLTPMERSTMLVENIGGGMTYHAAYRW